MKIFRGEKQAVGGCTVYVENSGYTAELSLEKSFQVVQHSPTGFQWGYGGSGPAQLAAAILYEVTADPELTRRYYQDFKFAHVANWEDTFEITELEVHDWLRWVGALTEPPSLSLRHSDSN